MPAHDNTEIPAPQTATPHPLAVTFALPDESRDFVARLRNARKIRAGSLPVITGELGGRKIAVCHTGVGAESCRARITSFLQEQRPEILISSGFAGGLDPALKVGDSLVAQNFSDARLFSVATGQKILSSVLTTQPQVAQTPADKAALAARTGATTVDMETAIIAELCAQRGIPMLSLRGISDAAGDELPVAFPVWFDLAKQKPRIGALLWELATHPAKIFAFAKFVRGISRTRTPLTDALVLLIEKV